MGYNLTKIKIKKVEKYIKYDYLISPINGYISKNLVSNKGTIKKFGFKDIAELHDKFPGFPLECRATTDLKNKISNSRRKKRYLEDTDTPPVLSCFKDSKYKNLYLGIISKAIVANHDKEGYFEVHHVIPKSFGGSDHWSNLVRLTAREHFLCHYLLTRIVDRNSQDYYIMCHAFNMMGAVGDNQERYMNSRLFESAKIDAGKRMSVLQGGENNSQYGTRWVVNFSTRERKKIKAEELQDYLDKGWVARYVVNFSMYDTNGNRIKVIKEKPPIKIVKYREDNKLSPPSEHILSVKYIRDMSNTLSLVGFDFDAVCLDAEYLRIQKMLMDDIWVRNMSFVQVSQKYNANYMTLGYVAKAFGVKRRTL